MAKLLYIDAAGGLSGDMLAGALLDLGWPLSELEGLIKRMDLSGVKVSHLRVDHQGLSASRLEVEVPISQPHRHLADVLALVQRLPEPVAKMASRVFNRLAEAEGKVHGVPPSQVHFHEVGAADALVDVAAFCAGLNWLGVERVICSPLPLGRGFVKAAHGRLPLPAPAVLNLLEGVPIIAWPAEEETVTPTGAALASTLAHEFGPLPAMTLSAVGTGGGSRPSRVSPNVARLILGQPLAQPQGDQVTEIVCHLDDQSPEEIPLIFERLMEAGALDVAACPLYMKKGRPGLMLTVLSRPETSEELAALVLEQTTSLGVRLRPVVRRLLPRQSLTVETPWGPARVKRTQAGGTVRLHPEAEDVARICRRTHLAPARVRLEIMRLAESEAPPKD